MRKSFLFAQYRFVFVLFLFSSLMGGCIDVFTPVAPALCAAELAAANIYRSESQPLVNKILEYVPTATPIALLTGTPESIETPVPVTTPLPFVFDELRFQGARYAAFNYLVNETKRWTAVQTITLNDGSQAEIAITFISPGVIQAVFLSDILKGNSIPSDFQAQIHAALDKVAQRNELLFLVTVTSAGNTINPVSHGIKISTAELVLNNAENSLFKPSHNDYNLEQPINPFSKPVFGYIAYPLVKVQEEDGKCKQALDSTFDTNIFIILSSIKVDGATMGPYSWTIPYAALINTPPPSTSPLITMPPDFNPENMSPLPNPPNGISQNSDNKWQELARFIWWKVTLGN